MSYETLQILWFILIAILWIGFFFLEGFDFGVGMLLPFLGKKDEERRAIINAIGPVWDGNEVWLVTGGGALFAAFPAVYAGVFSGFYPAMMLLLVALIFRAVAIEFRSKQPMAWWRRTWDVSFSAASFLGSFLMGVAFGIAAGPASSRIIECAPKGEEGTGSSLMVTAIYFGGVLGTAIYAMFFTFATADAATGIVAFSDLDSQTFLHGFHITMAAGLVLSVAPLILSAIVPDEAKREA